MVSELLAQTDGSAMDRERLSSCVRDVLLNTPLQQDTDARTQEPTPWKCGNIQLPKFIGYEDRQSPTDFLDKFENFCLVTGVPDSKRVRQVLPAALEGTAKLWWRFAGGFEDWETFVKEFHAEFASVDYKHRLKEELDRRTQHPQENLRHFIHVIAEFYDRIGETVSDEEKVRRVRRQMHPKFQDLCEGLTFANLREFAKEAGGVMERAWHRLKYVPPPPRTDQVAKDLAFAELHPTVPNQCPPSTLAAVSAGVAPQPWWPLHPAAVQSSYCKDQMWVPTTMPCQPAPQLPPQWAVQQPQTLATSFQPMPQPTPQWAALQHPAWAPPLPQQGQQWLQTAQQAPNLQPASNRGQLCQRCGGVGHSARYCATGRQRNQQRCYRCNERGHLQANCPGNGRA